MNTIALLNTKLTDLQELIICELYQNNNISLLSKKLNLKPITVSKTISLLDTKGLYQNNELTIAGKKMVHYLNFRNETINQFLQVHHIEPTSNIIKQMKSLNMNIIISLKNTLV